jgi:polysaccharide export outer membrane protein
MRSATGFVRRVCTLCVILAIPFAIGAWAQEPAANNTAEQQNAPATATLPAAQPVSQAAQSASGAATNSSKSDDDSKDKNEKSTLATLGRGDLIEVNVYNVPELASKVRVSNSGEIYLPLIDYVHVEGLTQEEAQGLIEKRLADGGFVRNPHVTIFVDEFTSQGVTIIGEVGRPGVYPNIGDHKLYEVVSQAGGFNQNASRKIAILRRNQADPIRLTLPRNLADDLTGNVEIMPGDTISVPRAPIIYVVGDVGRPAGLLLDNGSLTVLQALALVGGTNKTAKLSASRIIRKGPDGGVTETKVEVKKMLEAKLPDMPLQPDDILFVPVSGRRVLAARTFEATMSLATAMAIYTIRP